jgi:hypothetical protein
MQQPVAGGGKRLRADAADGGLLLSLSRGVYARHACAPVASRS